MIRKRVSETQLGATSRPHCDTVNTKNPDDALILGLIGQYKGILRNSGTRNLRTLVTL